MRTAKGKVRGVCWVQVVQNKDHWRVSVNSLKTGFYKSRGFLEQMNNYLQGGDRLCCGVMGVKFCLRL
jgi:hypothetical protein